MTFKLLNFNIAILIFSGPAFAGGGLGTGDGFPGLQVIPPPAPLQLTQLASDPTLRLLIDRLTLQLPYLGYLFSQVLQKVENGPYRLQHVAIPYPYQYANSDHSERTDEDGLPTEASITVWNEFMQIAPLSQTQILIHEFAHIAFRSHDEAQTMRWTHFLMPLVAQERPLSLRELQSHFHQYTDLIESLRVHLPPQIDLERVQRATLHYRTRAPLTELCQQGGSAHGFPVPPPSFALEFRTLTEIDPVIRAFRTECLSQSEGGRSLTLGWVESTNIHTEFLAALGVNLDFVLSREVDGSEGSFPMTENAMPQLPRLLTSLRSLSEAPARVTEVLRSRTREFAQWQSARQSWFNETELRRELNYGWGDLADHLVRRFQRQFASPALWLITPTGLVEANTRRSLGNTIRTPNGESATCRITSIDSGTRWECTHLTPGLFGTRRLTRTWILDAAWATRILQTNSGSAPEQALDSWPILRWTE
jgi:hypothetical protein